MKKEHGFQAQSIHTIQLDKVTNSLKCNLCRIRWLIKSKVTVKTQPQSGFYAALELSVLSRF